MTNEEDEEQGEAKKPIEAWAEQKGMYPAETIVKTRIAGKQATRKQSNPRHTDFVMAKAHRNWPEGKEVTEAEFDEAVKEAGKIGLL